jgi:hypothetical protein
VCLTTPCEMPGGSLGGTSSAFDSSLTLFMAGTGELAGFTRLIEMPMTSVVHTGPRIPGNPVQTFPTDYFSSRGRSLEIRTSVLSPSRGGRISVCRVPARRR